MGISDLLRKISSENFQRAIPHIIALEVGPKGSTGGYVNDPDDLGGETKWGISKRAYPKLDIKNLSRSAAEEIYFRDYWRAGGADALPWPLSLVHFDASVNHGVGRARKFLNFTRDWKTYLKLRESFYRDIAKRHPSQMKYLVAKDGSRGGWLRRLDYLFKVASTE